MATLNSEDNCTLDFSVLDKINEYARSNDEPHMMNDLLRIFLDTTPVRLEKLAHAERTGDIQTVQIIAHSLKSSCAYLGARRMNALCLQLEQMCASKQPLDASRLVHQIKSEYSQVKIALQRALTFKPGAL